MARKFDKKRGRQAGPAGGAYWLYGRHAVGAALANPGRQALRLRATANALTELGPLPAGLAAETMDARELARALPPDGVHQGLAMLVAPLAPPHLADVLSSPAPDAPVLVLDQVTDPHNVGAILRSAAAFGAAALITQDRNSPAESGPLAKAASGALEVVPWLRVVNLARTLEALADAGYWRIGLDGAAPGELAPALPQGPLCLVLGAEGRGLRPNTAAHCDALARLPISDRVESLNVSTAAAVALYIATRQAR
ncbi:MAG: TrmH family RNA methyltransferase [Pseudomonadota bacterium]